MAQFGLASYSIASLFYLILAVLLSTRWRGSLQGGLLLFAVVVSTLWAAGGVVAGKSEYLSLQYFLALEVVRNTLWLAFLWQLLSHTKIGVVSNWRQPIVYVFCVLVALTLGMEFAPTFAAAINGLVKVDVRVLSHVVQAVVGLVLVEQLFRNTRLERRWSIKFLCIALGVLFAYDFVLFSESLLFGRIDIQLWNSRGVVNALIVPLLAVSAARNPEWSVDIFVSRSMVFHTTALMATGVYLLMAAVVGYYIRDYGGSWGRVGQIVFLVGAVLILLLLMFSGQMRARIRVFVSRHFFAYKYDYRKEWLDLNRTIAEGDGPDALRESCIRGVADIVDSPGGLMWLRRDPGQFALIAAWNMPASLLSKVDSDDSLVRFLDERRWIVEVSEYQRTEELYKGLDLYPWYHAIPNLWLIIPLVHQNALYGFIGLSNPRAARDINWEDHDLLKTVGQQLASYVGLIDASDELASARQFEAYNRMSAFIVHDLKNLVAQLSLIVANAPKHKRNPEFVDDVIDTLGNSVDKMNRLLSQLRKGREYGNGGSRVRLSGVLASVVAQQNRAKPVPQVGVIREDLSVTGDKSRMIAVLAHLVQNAQDATPDDGLVELRLYGKNGYAQIEISDNGCGMDAAFVRSRLFKPFDTTKGNAGMGIGVFEARQFATELGGALEVESAPSKGTTFTLSLPLYTSLGGAEEGLASARGQGSESVS